jgi:xylulokinase
MLTFDMGTTGCKAAVVDDEGRIRAISFRGYPVISKEPGCAEQDPNEWWKAARETSREALERGRIRSEEVAGVGFCGTMGGALSIDVEGRLCRNLMILYSDNRAVEQARRLKRRIGSSNLYRISGNPVSPIPSLAKWLWIKENDPEVFEKTKKFLCPKDYLVFKSTETIQTDYVDASATMAFDLRRHAWSHEILEEVGVPLDKLPEPRPATEVAGELTSKAAADLNLRSGTPVIVGSGDTGALLIGVGAVRDKMAAVYLGAAAEIDITTDSPLFDEDCRVPVRCHAIPNMWFNSGTALTSGVALKWFVDQFSTCAKAGSELSYSALDEMAERVPRGSRGLIFLPYLLGERTPIWDPRARGAFIGLSLASKWIDFYRSILEGTAFSLRHISEVLTEMGVTPVEARLCGGGAKSELWRNIVRDVLGMRCSVTSNQSEVSALGVAACIGVATRLFRSVEEGVSKMVKIESSSDPDPAAHSEYEKLFKLYRRCYPSLKYVMHGLAETR